MNHPINLPCLRGLMGDWIYYVAVMPLQEIALRVKTAEEIRRSEFLRDMLQRSLEDRTEEIAHYLSSHEQRFFSAIVIGVYDGAPTWNPISISSTIPDSPSFVQGHENTMGVLSLRGDERLFAIDGQHRVEGIKTFLSGLTSERIQDEICCIFVAHKTDDNGMRRTRKLFSTLNRYAKPVSLTDIISLNEDDIVAIVCRELLERHPLFSKKGRVSLKKGKNIGTSDKHAFTSLVSLYQFIDVYLAVGGKQSWDRYKAKRPDDEALNDAIRRVMFFWDCLIEHIPELERVRDLPDGAPIPVRLRGSHGGDLFLRPVFLPLLAKCMKDAITWGMSESEFIRRLSAIPREISEFPWRDVLWDGSMQVQQDVQKTTRDMILWMINADPDQNHVAEGVLKEHYAKVSKRDILKVQLPVKLF